MIVSYFVLIVASLLCSSISSASVPAILLLDSFSQSLSGYVKKYCHEHGIVVIEGVSPYSYAMLTSKGAELPEEFKVPAPGLESAWVESMLPDDAHLMGCVSESDAGVPTAERVSRALNLPCNGIGEHVRNKYLMNVRLSERGLRTARQAIGSEWSDIRRALENNPALAHNKAHGSFECIVKPYRGVASDGVFLCLSLEETEAAFNALIHTPKYGGGELDRVLVQEYLRGPEYAIDTVSGGGHTKILAVWRYQKMPMNDAAFVYQCSELVDAVGVDGHLLPVCEYCLKALDALDVAWGPCHTEVKDTVDGPTMIEVNPRWHAQDFCPITRLCLSTDSLVSTVDAFVFPEKFEALPLYPAKRKSYGMIVHLISVVEGTVSRVNHIGAIKSLRSFVAIELSYEVGEEIVKTRDIRTDSGYVLLHSDSDEQLQADYNKVCELQYTMFDI